MPAQLDEEVRYATAEEFRGLASKDVEHHAQLVHSLVNTQLDPSFRGVRTLKQEATRFGLVLDKFNIVDLDIADHLEDVIEDMASMMD